MAFPTQSKNSRTTKKNDGSRKKMVQRSDKLGRLYREGQKSHYQTVSRRYWRTLFMKVIQNIMLRVAPEILRSSIVSVFCIPYITKGNTAYR